MLVIGRRLRRRRRTLGMTQQKLADLCAVRPQMIHRYECGANQISAARLWRLARVLEIPIGYFFENMPAMTEDADRD
jgi:transcriptional regulator with XRE-family HTH domain